MAKQGAKFGRNRSRSPSMAHYNAVRKDKLNKAKRVARHSKAVAAAKAKKECAKNPVVRGAARALRRTDMVAFANLRRWKKEKAAKTAQKAVVTIHYTKGPKERTFRYVI